MPGRSRPSHRMGVVLCQGRPAKPDGGHEWYVEDTAPDRHRTRHHELLRRLGTQQKRRSRAAGVRRQVLGAHQASHGLWKRGHRRGQSLRAHQSRPRPNGLPRSSGYRRRGRCVFSDQRHQSSGAHSLMNYEVEALNLISAARAYIMDYHKDPCAPYISDTLLNLTPVPVRGLKHAMGVTTGLVLYFNPERVCLDPELSKKEVMAGALVHEAEHVLRGIWRLEALADKERANIAGGMAINGPLREEGWKLPHWVIYHDCPEFNFPPNLTLEQYYDLLTEKAQDYGGSTREMMDKLFGDGDEEGEGEEGEEGGNEDGEGKGDGEGDGEGKAPGGSGKKWKPDIGSGGCGSAGGNAPDPEVEGKLDQEHGRSEVEVESIRRNTLDAIADWVSRKGIGRDPGRFKEMIDSRYKKPDVNWRRVLRRVVRLTVGEIRRGSRDYSVRRPSLSSPFLGVLLSGPIDGDPEIVCIRDTSLSMGDKELQSTNVEIIGAIKIRPKPNVFIYMTDGCGTAPAAPPPGVAFIWCIVRTSQAMRPAPWGKVVVCDPNQRLG